MAAPFFVRKKFLKYYGLFVLLLLVIGIIHTISNAHEMKEKEGTVRWEVATVPMSYPIIGLVGYLLILPMWVVYKVKMFRDQAISRVPRMFEPVPVTLPAGEIQFGEPDRVGYAPPNGRPVLGELRFTNHRFLFTKMIDVRRVGEIYGLPTPDLSISISLNEIRQCGFGLDEKNPKNFLVIDNVGNVHTFSSIVKFNAEIAMKELNWKRTQVGEYIYWIR